MEALVHATWLSTARSPDVMGVFTVDYWGFCMERMEGLVIFNFVQCHFVNYHLRMCTACNEYIIGGGGENSLPLVELLTEAGAFQDFNRYVQRVKYMCSRTALDFFNHAAHVPMCLLYSRPRTNAGLKNKRRLGEQPMNCAV